MRCFALWELWELQLFPEYFSGNLGLETPFPSLFFDEVVKKNDKFTGTFTWNMEFSSLPFISSLKKLLVSIHPYTKY